jgi:hypothetical protein
VAKCDEGYRCEVCGLDVEVMTDSDLYLRYILDEVPLDRLHRSPERHLRCNPSLTQYIVDPAFDPVACTGPFSKTELDPLYVVDEEKRITRAWRRLQALPTMGLTIAEYPLSVTPEE